MAVAQPPRPGQALGQLAQRQVEPAYRCLVQPAAIVDRLTFNATIIETGTESYRLARAKTGTARPAA